MSLLSVTPSGSFGSSLGPRQKFSQEYLAKQLPVFQERVPRGVQGRLKYPTDAPPNLPLPPLLPGEEILLKQHRVVCLDCFAEPAVGSIYITNFRVIFNGNSISDPESREAILEGLPVKKDSVHTQGGREGGRKIWSNRQPMQSATFNSYLTNPEQRVPPKPGLQTRWQDFKMNSLKRPSRSSSENNVNSLTRRKSASMRRMQNTSNNATDATDGGGSSSSGGGTFEHVWSEIGSAFNRGARSLRVTKKNRGQQQPTKEAVQWDSVSSISSVSELSECPTTGTDESRDRDLEQNVSPLPRERIFTVGSVETTISDISINGSVPHGSGYPIPEMVVRETPSSSQNTEDSGIIITDPLSVSWNAASGISGQEGGVAGKDSEEVDFEKYSSSILALDPIIETEAQRLDLESSVDPSLLMDPSREQARQEETRRSWFHKNGSVATCDGDSISDDNVESEEDERNRTLTQVPTTNDVAVGYSKVEIVAPLSTGPQQLGSGGKGGKSPQVSKSAPERSTSPIYSTPVVITGSAKLSRRSRENTLTESSSPTMSRSVDSGDSPAASHRKKPLPPTPPKKPHSLSSSGSTGSAGSESAGGTEKTSESGGRDNRHGDGERLENGREEGEEREGDGGEKEGVKEYANFMIFKKLVEEEKRDRSSSNPSPLKKPKPLPRINKASTLGRIDSKDTVFGGSLPADFRPTPLPRKPTLTSRSSASPSDSPTLPRSHPPISPKPSPTLPRSQPPISPKPSPSLPRSHPPPPPPPPSQSTPDTGPVDEKPNNSLLDSPNEAATGSKFQVAEERDKLTKLSDSDQPVPPPRRKRKAKTTPSAWRQPLSPIYSPTDGSPVKSVGTSSDAGSSDLPDTSSESDHSHPRYKFLPSPSPVPRSPSPVPEGIDWYEEQSQNSSMVAQRHSLPSSVRSSFPNSPLDLPSTYSYMGDREPLPPATTYSTLGPHPPPRSLSPLPTSTRYSFSCSLTLSSIHSIKKQPALVLKEDGIRLPEGIMVRARNFRYMKLHIHPNNTFDAEALKELLEKRILAEKPPQELFAFHYCAAIRHPNPNFLHTTSLPNFFKLHDELERMKLTSSRVWHMSSVLQKNPELSPSYPREVIVPRCIPDLDLVRGTKLYRHGRFPTLSWASQDGSVFLLRAAPTVTHRGQSGSSGMCLDEAILQAVCVSTEKAQGSTKLYIYTEKPESSAAALSDPMHTSLSEAQKRAYYYHNCQFEYLLTPSTHKNIRHSFNKLSAVLEESKVGDDEYLIALDDTRWLYRVHELLETASAVARKLEEECASVLISYDSGWDRTSQVCSLTQLLLDPYFRTMDGFQILVQKEWLWFGHPFQSRHTRRPGRVKEDGPIFLQWVDCVWQVMQQCPSAFEFNEKFLMVMVEASYSSQFGTFLLNSEQERRKMFSGEAHKHKSVSTHTLSFWTWVSMVNAAGRTFYNALYDTQTHPWVICPNSSVPCLKLWTNHYSQSKFEEHQSTTTTVLQKQLDHLVRVYQKLSGQVDQPLPTSAPTRSLSISPSPSEDSSRSTPKLERDRDTGRVRSSGRAARSKTPVLYQTIEQYLTTQGIDTTVCKHAEIAGNTCQGYLVKLGGVRKNWQERWFVLDFASQLLTYFENREAYTGVDRGSPKGVIGLNDMSKVWQNTKRKEHLIKHVFTVETKNRIYLFRAPSLITMQLWMAVLNMPHSALQVDT